MAVLTVETPNRDQNQISYLVSNGNGFTHWLNILEFQFAKTFYILSQSLQVNSLACWWVIGYVFPCSNCSLVTNGSLALPSVRRPVVEPLGPQQRSDLQAVYKLQSQALSSTVSWHVFKNLLKSPSPITRYIISALSSKL